MILGSLTGSTIVYWVIVFIQLERDVFLLDLKLGLWGIRSSSISVRFCYYLVRSFFLAETKTLVESSDFVFFLESLDVLFSVTQWV